MAEQNTPDQDVSDITSSSGGGVAYADDALELPTKRKVGNIRFDLYDEEEYDMEEYEALLEMYEDTLSNIEEGEIVTARVLRVTDKVVIDFDQAE